jgi:hypothetical protein
LVFDLDGLVRRDQVASLNHTRLKRVRKTSWTTSSASLAQRVMPCAKRYTRDAKAS